MTSFIKFTAILGRYKKKDAVLISLLCFIDRSMDLDLIDYDLLIAQLHAYGFRKTYFCFVLNYLNVWSKRVKLNSFYSIWECILSGVLQGSVLGNAM